MTQRPLVDDERVTHAAIDPDAGECVQFGVHPVQTLVHHVCTHKYITLSKLNHAIIPREDKMNSLSLLRIGDNGVDVMDVDVLYTFVSSKINAVLFQ